MAENKNFKDRSPNWKRDFPVDQEEATHVSRREFAKFLGLLSGALAMGNGAIVVKSMAFPHKSLEGEHFVCNAADLAPGEMHQFEIEGNKTIPYILIHLPEGGWRAFEQKCTHLACAVRYRADIDRIECPCHRGYFDARTGIVIEGPPPRPLPQLEAFEINGKIYVKAMSEPLNA